MPTSSESVFAHPDSWMNKPGCWVTLGIAMLGLAGTIVVGGSSSTTPNGSVEATPTPNPVSSTVDTGTQYAAPTQPPSFTGGASQGVDNGCVLSDRLFGMLGGGIGPNASGRGSALKSGAKCADGSSPYTQSSPQQVDTQPSAPVNTYPTPAPPAAPEIPAPVIEYAPAAPSSVNVQTTSNGQTCTIPNPNGGDPFVVAWGQGFEMNGVRYTCPRYADTAPGSKKSRRRRPSRAVLAGGDDKNQDTASRFQWTQRSVASLQTQLDATRVKASNFSNPAA